MQRSTILVASADANQHQLIDLLLSQDAHELVPVTNAKDALAYLRSNTPDLSIFATDLPDLSGEALCRKSKAVSRLRAMPVVLLVAKQGHATATGAGTYLHQVQGRTGADAVVPMPLGDKDLRGRVNRLLSARETALS